MSLRLVERRTASPPNNTDGRFRVARLGKAFFHWPFPMTMHSRRHHFKTFAAFSRFVIVNLGHESLGAGQFFLLEDK